MFRITGPIVLTAILCTTWSVAPVWAQSSTGMTRHQRIAASILRRKAASSMAARIPGKATIQRSVGALQEALPEGAISPPAPPATLQSTPGVSDLIDGAIGSGTSPAMPAADLATPIQPSPVQAAPAPVPATQAYPAEAYPTEAYPTESYPAESYPTQSYSAESYPAESYPAAAAPSYPAESYPVTPYESIPSEVSYADPFSSPVSSPVYESSVVGCADGCAGGCGGCAAAPACGLPGYGGGCAGGCAGCGGANHSWISTISLFGGVHGYKNGVNRGNSGSFGFQEGFNWGSPFSFSALGMNSQIGFRATQTDFNGSSFTADTRAQFFVTGGFFKRNYNGWQGGFVFDYLHDDWYTTIDLAQIRGELSYGVPNGSSVGLMFATSVSEDDTTSVLNGATFNDEWETQDYYAFFYEVQSNHHRRGQWRVWVGMTGESDGIIGSYFKLPMAGTWSLEPEFTYVVPDEATGAGGVTEESWNVGVNLVWYPGRALGDLNYARLPMFDVASNGSMITRRK